MANSYKNRDKKIIHEIHVLWDTAKVEFRGNFSICTYINQKNK